MENQVKTYLKIWNWFIFTALTFLCGGFVGAVTVSFLQIMRFAINLLWAKVPQSFFCIVIFGIKINLLCDSLHSRRRSYRYLAAQIWRLSNFAGGYS